MIRDPHDFYTLADMKTQHIKFEILKKKPKVYSLAILYNKIFSICKIYKENFHPFGDVMDGDIKIWMFATGKRLIQLFQKFCTLTG